jgi:hypothetical protein
MTQQLFEDLTADAPPSTVDVPGIVRREKRRRTVVRVGMPAAAVLAVASAIAVLAPGGAPRPAPSAVAEPPSAGTTTAVAPTPGFRLVANNKAAAVATAATLRSALDAAVRKVAPGATWLKLGLTVEFTPDGQPPRIFSDDLKRPTDQMFTGTTGISLDGKRGTLGLNIISINPCTGGALTKCPSEHASPAELRKQMLKVLFACQPAAAKCAATTGRDGRRQRVQTSPTEDGFVSQETTVELADGRALMLTVDNQFIAPEAKDNSNSVAQSTTPLSPTQVTAAATAIGDQILP